ncbi:septal ring lytic transglycosylase RlpA family protein [Candidatus Thiothrix sp. Deng01]|uniref:Endolytic peptidoglycan transglycosylase RlpA n=1 Tax=Candidatus Thiothrix phosphatis TaxID=3112415 RepID=A0ABU6D1A7_9GAMM|nr:septal ring lytic transglycosylase RlpA family protein [Candidatus Thiothrix sp. Deng01]MEB4592147.1 septal ring lytic transglycosylase RlpA family protein [Candidatus Thiothrix sp. Deng01]
MMTINWQVSGILLASVMMVLAACSSNGANKAEAVAAAGAAGQDAANSAAARGGCGNDANYTINDQSYHVLNSADGYTESGTAAWYGAEYQGTETAGCEVFDMYGYSAAHRTLPLPSFARVTNQQNGKSIVVRINDRGPFDSGDLIQLSFAAANALGIKARSGAPVQVEAIAQSQLPADMQMPAAPPPPAVAMNPKPSEPVDKSKPYYVIAGTWPDQNTALDMFVRLTSVGLGKAEMATAKQDGREMYQVRIGPLYNQDQIDNVKDMLESNGLTKFKVVAR